MVVAIDIFSVMLDAAIASYPPRMVHYGSGHLLDLHYPRSTKSDLGDGVGPHRSTIEPDPWDIMEL
jgi:hypothetical protein